VRGLFFSLPICSGLKRLSFLTISVHHFWCPRLGSVSSSPLSDLSDRHSHNSMSHQWRLIFYGSWKGPFPVHQFYWQHVYITYPHSRPTHLTKLTKPEVGRSIFCQNIGIHLQGYEMLQPRIPQSESIMTCQILYIFSCTCLSSQWIINMFLEYFWAMIAQSMKWQTTDWTAGALFWQRQWSFIFATRQPDGHLDPYQMYTVIKQLECEAQLHLMSSLKMCRFLPPFPLYAFVTWCLITGTASSLAFMMLIGCFWIETSYSLYIHESHSPLS
jgi:hypothetical protein